MMFVFVLLGGLQRELYGLWCLNYPLSRGFWLLAWCLSGLIFWIPVSQVFVLGATGFWVFLAFFKRFQTASQLWQTYSQHVLFLVFGLLLPGYALEIIKQDGTLSHFVFWVGLVTGGDVVAYGVGRWQGRRFLWPHVSPRKTREGLLAALVYGLIFSGVGGVWVQGWPWFKGFLASLGIFWAVAGDLWESAFKRVIGVKDSGNWIPGHGGLWDRFDALVFSAAYYSWVLKWPQ